MNFHLAQINIGRLIAPIDDPRIAGFVSQLDPLNALADAAPGYIGRLQSASGNATDIPYSGEDPSLMVNMSVWESVEALRDFVYASKHLEVFRERAKWFEKMGQADLLSLVGACGPHPNRAGRPRAPGALPEIRSDALFVLVFEIISGSRRTRRIPVAQAIT